MTFIQHHIYNYTTVPSSLSFNVCGSYSVQAIRRFHDVASIDDSFAEVRGGMWEFRDECVEAGPLAKGAPTQLPWVVSFNPHSRAGREVPLAPGGRPAAGPGEVT